MINLVVWYDLDLVLNDCLADWLAAGWLTPPTYARVNV